jgi:pyruvate dehydrogenase E2 component (dihydrolipoamide acetyltransferase)
MDVRIPNLAEGISSGTIVSFLVAEGDNVKKGQTLLELETEKAVAPVPSPCDGVIAKIEAAVGDAVVVGKRVMIISEAGTAGSSNTESQTTQTRQVPIDAPSPVAPVIVPAPSAQTEVQADYQYVSASGFPPPASPSLRKMARELGIDLTKVKGSAAGGRITSGDVRAYIDSLQSRKVSVRPAQLAPEAPQKSAPPSIDFSKFGPVTRTPMTSLRKKISEKMTASWQSIPHVFQFAEADVTEMSRLREKYVKEYEKAGVRLTLTGLILKSIAKTLNQHPVFNASIDEAAGEIVYKNYINLGLAVDTEQGLIVPVIRNVEKKSFLEISRDIAALAEKTRLRKIAIEDLQGGTFTVSNQGGIGGAHFTPIINKPEVAILGLGRAVAKPVAVNSRIVVSTVMPVCLSYDHRLIDGGSAARFITDLVGNFEKFEESELRLATSVKSDSKVQVKKKRKS